MTGKNLYFLGDYNKFFYYSTPLSVFFQCHRTTISETFYSVLNYLALACKNLVLIIMSMSDYLLRFHHA